MSYLSGDCLFDATGPAPDGTRHVGHKQIRDAWKAIFDDPSSKFEPEETFGSSDRVVQRWRYKWDGGHVRGSICSRSPADGSLKSCRTSKDKD